MMGKLILDLSDEIFEYTGGIPAEAWDYDSEISEYGTPEELALTAACNYFGNFEMEEWDKRGRGFPAKAGYLEPHDAFYFDVLHSLTINADAYRSQQLTRLVGAQLQGNHLVLTLTNEMDMASYQNETKPPRG